MNANSFFMRMCKEAEEELANGKKGWKEADTNTLLLAAFGMLSNHLTSRIVRPLWFFSGSVFTATLAYIISLIASGG